MGEEHDRIKQNKRHRYQRNQYVTGYVPGDEIRDVEQIEGDIIISSPIIVQKVIRPRGVQVQVVQNMTPRVTASDGDFASDDQIFRVPIPGTYFIVILNGRVMQPAVVIADIATASCYFIDPTGTFRPQGEMELGDKLLWNGTAAGVEVEANDELAIVYEALPEGTKYIQSLAPMVTTADGDLLTADVIQKIPVAGTTVVLTHNGRVIIPADGPGEESVSAFYIESPTGQIRAYGQAQMGDVLRWNGSVAGTEIQLGDELLLVYET